MTDSTRLARCANSEPGSNYHFDRPWSPDLVVGPDVPAAPAHSYAWHPDVTERRQDALRRAKPSWQRAERAYERLVGGDRETNLHHRGDRG